MWLNSTESSDSTGQGMYRGRSIPPGLSPSSPRINTFTSADQITEYTPKRCPCTDPIPHQPGRIVPKNTRKTICKYDEVKPNPTLVVLVASPSLPLPLPARFPTSTRLTGYIRVKNASCKNADLARNPHQSGVPDSSGTDDEPVWIVRSVASAGGGIMRGVYRISH